MFGTRIARRGIIKAVDGELFSDWEAWTEVTRALEDDIYVNGFQVDIWHNTVKNDEADLDSVLVNFETNQNKLNFLDILRTCIPLYDPENLLGHWKVRASAYPPALRRKIILENFAHIGSGNANIHLHRGDLNILYGLVSGSQKRIFNILLALNKCIFPLISE